MKVWTLESSKIFICTQSVCLSEKFLKLSTNFYVDNYVAFITTESGNLRESTDRKKKGRRAEKMETWIGRPWPRTRRLTWPGLSISCPHGTSSSGMLTYAIDRVGTSLRFSNTKYRRLVCETWSLIIQTSKKVQSHIYIWQSVPCH